MKKPFGVWIILGSLIYAALGTIVAVVDGIRTKEVAIGSSVAISAFVFAALFVGAAVLSLRVKRWAYLPAAVLSILFLGNFATQIGEFVSNPSIWTPFSSIFSTFFSVILALVFSMIGLVRGERKLNDRSYFSSPFSVGGLVALVVIGFVLGGLFIGYFAGATINRMASNVSPPAGGIGMTYGAGNSSSSTFAPKVLTVVIGVNNTVTWSNSDIGRHTVTSRDGGALNSGGIEAGGSWSYTFTSLGTYEYYCTYHPWMTGEVIVRK